MGLHSYRQNTCAEVSMVSQVGGRHLVVYGGWHGDFIHDVYVLDVWSMVWEYKETKLAIAAQLGGPISGRAGHTACLLPGRLHNIGEITQIPSETAIAKSPKCPVNCDFEDFARGLVPARPVHNLALPFYGSFLNPKP